MATRHAIVAFSGHMTDAPDRSSPRFPEKAVPSVRARVRAALAAKGGKLIGVSSAARGGDLIFIEELLALGGSAIVLLPFPAQDFKTTSVEQGWNETFDRLLRSEKVNARPPINAQLPKDSSQQNAAYEACNVAIIDTAERLAVENADEDPVFLALYQQTDADRQGGTAHAFAGWTKLGHRLEIIDPRD